MLNTASIWCGPRERSHLCARTRPPDEETKNTPIGGFCCMSNPRTPLRADALEGSLATPDSLPPTFGRPRPPVTVCPLGHRLPHIVLRGSLSVPEGRFNASQVLAQPRQNKFAAFAARHLGAKQFEDKRIGRLANSLDSCRCSLSFEARQPSAVDKILWVLADRGTTKLGNALGGRTQNNRKSR